MCSQYTNKRRRGRRRRRRRCGYGRDTSSLSYALVVVSLFPSLFVSFFPWIHPIFSFTNKPTFGIQTNYRRHYQDSLISSYRKSRHPYPPRIQNTILYSSRVTKQTSPVDYKNHSTHHDYEITQKISNPSPNTTLDSSLLTSIRTNTPPLPPRSTAMLSQKQIQDIKSQVDILTMIESFNIPQFTRHPDGIHATAICPFHEDSRPSLSIDNHRGLFKCFACGVGGDIFHFIREYDYRIRSSSSSSLQYQNSNSTIVMNDNISKMSYPHAIQFVVQTFLPRDQKVTFEKYLPLWNNHTTANFHLINSTLFKQLQQQHQSTSANTAMWYEYHSKHTTDKERIYLANLAAADYYGNLLVTLPMAGIARTHLRQRKIQPTTVRSFALGYAPDCYFQNQQYYRTSSTTHNATTTSFHESTTSKLPLSLVQHLHQLGFTPTEIIDAGLAVFTTSAKKRIQGQLHQWQRKKQQYQQRIALSSSSSSLTTTTTNFNTNTTINHTIDITTSDNHDSNPQLLLTFNNTSSTNPISTNPMKPPVIVFQIHDIMDRFRSRLMVPIFDFNGTHIVGFGGRYLGDHEQEQQQQTSKDILHTKNESMSQEEEEIDLMMNNNPRRSTFTNAKYINSPESVVFSKKHILFGLHSALSSSSTFHWETQSSIKESTPPSLVVVEGYFDAIALHDVGVYEAVASMGTSLSLEQMTLMASILQKHNLSGKTSKLILCLDNDSAGIRAVARLCQGNILHDLDQAFSVSINVATLPEGIKDPSDYIEAKKNMGAIQLGDSFRKEILDYAKPWECWYITHLVNTLITSDPTSLSVACNRIAKFISTIQDSEEQQRYITLTMDRIFDRQRSINTTVAMRSVVESEISNTLLKKGHTTDKYNQSNTLKRKGLLKLNPLQGFSKDPKVRPASQSTVFKRQLKVRRSFKKNDPLIQHFSGFKFNPLDTSWLGIDEAEVWLC